MKILVSYFFFSIVLEILNFSTSLVLVSYKPVSYIKKTCSCIVVNLIYPVQFTDIFISRWSLDNTTYGAYSSPVIGSDKYSYINLKAPVNKILWFGGEAATDVNNYGYTQGAYTGGRKQAEELLACMKDASKCPVNKPREQASTVSSSIQHMPPLLFSVFLVILLHFL